jgi:hemoglobin
LLSSRSPHLCGDRSPDVSTSTSAGRASVPGPEPSPYEIIGGARTVRSAVERLYFWISRDDDLFNRYFREVNLGELKAHMVALLSQTLGGPKTYSGREMAAAHAHLRITAAHYDRVVDYVEASLLVEHCPRPILAAVSGVLATLKPVIVTGGR